MNAKSIPTTGKISASLPVLSFHRTNSNTPGKVSAYPAQCIPEDLSRFLFSSPRKTYLYSCDAHSAGMGVVK
jgi:hypothetical protein